MGINLGYSSKHALNVSLILNLQTGLVSPQYHCIYDDLFETTTGTQGRSIPKSQWQYLAGLAISNSGSEPQEGEEMVSNEEDEYYSSNESEDAFQRNDMETDSGEEDQTGDIYKARSGRTVRPPERLTYDAHACLLTQDVMKS